MAGDIVMGIIIVGVVAGFWFTRGAKRGIGPLEGRAIAIDELAKYGPTGEPIGRPDDELETHE